jgi:hypothetical protein
VESAGALSVGTTRIEHMIEQRARQRVAGDGSSAAELLAAASERRRVADTAEAELLELACGWAEAHPPESIQAAAVFQIPGTEGEEQIAGEGCPLVAEFCIAEFGAVLGMSTVSAKHLIGQALELKYRLPRLYRRVQAGAVPAWRARRVAEATIHAHPPLSKEAAGWVDAQVAPFAARCGTAQVDRLVAEAIRRFGPPVSPEDPDDPCPQGPDTRHVTVDREQVAYAGTLRIEAELDIADAHDVDLAVAQGADLQKALGSTDGLGARRAKALGEMARRQLALDLAGPAGATDNQAPLPTAREVVLHLHFPASVTADADAAIGGGILVDDQGRLEEGQRLVLLQQVKEWCGDSHTRVLVKPVIDPDQHIWVPGYDVSDRLREQVILRDQTCVFPWCTHPARRCQMDHVIPYDHHHPDRGGQTASDNIAPLCTKHHRLKTHGRWRYQMTALGVFRWTSPHGHQFHRDHTGTTALASPQPVPGTRRRR